MSYFPSPYSPPSEFSTPIWPPAEALWPARRASILLFVLCGLLLAPAIIFFVASKVPLDKYPPDEQRQLEQYAAPSGMSFNEDCLILSVSFGITAVVLGVLAFWVRRGRFPAIVTAMAFDGLMMILVAMQLISAIVEPQADAIPVAMVLLGVDALTVLLMVWLVAAARAARNIKAMAEQYQAQYGQAADSEGFLYGQTLPPPPEDQTPAGG